MTGPTCVQRPSCHGYQFPGFRHGCVVPSDTEPTATSARSEAKTSTNPHGPERLLWATAAALHVCETCSASNEMNQHNPQLSRTIMGASRAWQSRANEHRSTSQKPLHTRRSRILPSLHQWLLRHWTARKSAGFSYADCMLPANNH